MAITLLNLESKDSESTINHYIERKRQNECCVNRGEENKESDT